MAGTGFRRSLAFVGMPLVIILAGLIFVNSKGLWDKITALEAGVFSITMIAYLAFQFDNPTAQHERVPTKSLAGCLGMLFLLFTLAGMILFYLQRYAGLRLVDPTIAFPLLFFVPTVSSLIYVLTLVAARFHPDTDARSHS